MKLERQCNLKSDSDVACLAHMRRKFIEAKGNNKKTGKADMALNLIGKLYGIVLAIKDKLATEKLKVRQQKARPIVEELYQWVLKNKDKIPPKMALGKPIKYAINQFEKFWRYLEDGRIKIDNSSAERAIKPFVIGRKTGFPQMPARVHMAVRYFIALLKAALCQV
ncbi:IS66 family transposase [Pseudoalteromonas nigrifaciens]|uniref:IS66 family transposase n=1 Tax=Pseudoalteromonas nigrifaciens TaxID=28109 RepID=UPI00299F8AFD|nr:transposase [Pseudoalteromonas nigrifaciens]